MALATFSANGNYQIDVDAAVVSQNQAGNYSTIYWRIYVIKGNTYGHAAWGSTGSWGNADSNFGGNPDLWNNGNMEYNFQNGQYGGSFLIVDGTFIAPHNSDGNQVYYVTGSLNLANLGYASASTGVRSLPRLAREPDAPTPLWVSNITQTSMDYRFSGNYDGGSPIIEYQALYQEGNGPQIALGWENDGLVNMTGLKPATWYNFWSRGRNSIGWGPWSQIMSGRTLAGARVNQGGVWKEALPYVNQGGTWKLAQPYSKINGVWRKAS